MSTEDELRELRALVRKLEERITQLEKENAELRAELHKFKNSNTPPSANPHLKPDVTPKILRGKPGAPVGHAGTTRPTQEANEQRVITEDTCPDGHSDVTVIGSRKQQVEELPPEIKPDVVDVIRHKLKCNTCGIVFWARDHRTPMQGRFGLNLIVFTILLKFVLRGVLRKTASFLETGFAFQITPATVNAIIARAAQAAEGEYSALTQKIRKARIVYVDETSISVLGVKWWVWVFRTDADVLLVIRHSRGNSVPDEILGKSFTGIVICDGWRAYDYLENASIQRCWAHLLRKSAELTTTRGKRFHHKLKLLFARIERFNCKTQTEEQRLRKYEQLTRKLKTIITYYSHYSECESVTKYVGFRLEEWFTCVKLNGVEPTNNFAEQALRETVVVRKIIGAFRSEHGTKVYETLASLLATWKLQKLDVATELRRVLATSLC